MIQYRRNLPHLHPEDAVFFITFRLKGSLPLYVIKKLKSEMEMEIEKLTSKYGNNRKKINEEKYLIQKKYFGKFDQLLNHAAFGPVWLKEEKIADIVKNKLHEMDDKFYSLIAYTIMPNHVHSVFYLKEEENLASVLQKEISVGRKKKKYPLSKVMQLLKGATAQQCNQVLNRSGYFWHHESYDHYVRDVEELVRIIEYILYDPVKAGLVSRWEDWNYSYCVYL